MELIRLVVRLAPDGGWDLSLRRREDLSVGGRVAPEDVASAQRAAEALRDLPDSAGEAEFARVEAEAGRALSATLERSGPPTRAWLRALGVAEERGEPLVVLLDADPPVHDLPWELLTARSDGTPLEALGAGSVARLAAGAPTLRETAAEPTRCAAVTAGAPDTHQQVFDVMARIAKTYQLPTPRNRATRGPRVVALLGRVGDPQLDLRAPTGTETARLLGGAEFAWVSLEHDTSTLPRALASMANAALAAGCPAAVQSPAGSPPEAATAFAGGLFHALFGGEGALAAVVAGRAFLREAQLPRAESRWWRPRLWVSHAAALARAPMSRRVEPSAWPRPSDAGARLLRRARAAGEVDGFVGLEHLIEATLDLAPPDLTDLLPALRAAHQRFRRRVAALQPQRRSDPRVQETPRLVRLAARLPDDFGPAELWAAAFAERHAWGRWLEISDDAVTPPDRFREPAARALEVLGGPEDGRVLRLESGHVLGRHSTSRRGNVTLYERTPWSDLHLSRRHLRWLDDGWVQLQVRARAVRRGREVLTDVEGPVEIRVGDLVELTPSTWVVGVAPGGDGE